MFREIYIPIISARISSIDAVTYNESPVRAAPSVDAESERIQWWRAPLKAIASKVVPSRTTQLGTQISEDLNIVTLVPADKITAIRWVPFWNRKHELPISVDGKKLVVPERAKTLVETTEGYGFSTQSPSRILFNVYGRRGIWGLLETKMELYTWEAELPAALAGEKFYNARDYIKTSWATARQIMDTCKAKRQFRARSSPTPAFAAE